MKQFALMMNQFELPNDFPHQSPEGYKYEVRQHKRNILSIWLRHPDRYHYTSDPVYTIWGFVKYKTTKRSISHTYHSPINSNKVGGEVNVNETRPWTAMPLNLNPLEAVFYDL